MRDRRNIDVKIEDVIQIDGGHRLFSCCFAVVTSVSEWGVVAEVYGPQSAVYPVRLEREQFLFVGQSEWRLKHDVRRPRELDQRKKEDEKHEAGT